MTDNQQLIRVEKVHKAYQKGEDTIDVLSDVSFSIRTGAMVSIVGSSGAGKSTLLHLLGTLDSPDQGEIYYNSEPLSTKSPSELSDFRNHELGFVFQFHHLLPEFSALENVMMPALIRRIPKGIARDSSEKALRDVGLAARMRHKPGELSGGEQQRVALARALVLDPPLLLADEVTGNLDDNTAEEVHQLLFELNATRGITLVIVTHNVGLADRMPQKLILDNGNIYEAL